MVEQLDADRHLHLVEWVFQHVIGEQHVHLLERGGDAASARLSDRKELCARSGMEAVEAEAVALQHLDTAEGAAPAADGAQRLRHLVDAVPCGCKAKGIVAAIRLALASAAEVLRRQRQAGARRRADGAKSEERRSSVVRHTW